MFCCCCCCLIEVVQNMNNFLQSELLSRRLAHNCCKRLKALFEEQLSKREPNPAPSTEPSTPQAPKSESVKTENTENQSTPTPKETPSSETTTTQTPKTEPIAFETVREIFNEILDNQSPLRECVIVMISIVNAIVLGAPQALIWNAIGDGRSESVYNGSPLDMLPCAPSELLTLFAAPSGNEHVISELKTGEECIRKRSYAVEQKWSTEQLQQVTKMTENRILAMLDILDRHFYETIENKSSIDVLFNQVIY